MTLFKMTLFQWRYGLLLFLAALWLSINSAQAAPNITCTANMNNGSINLGNITPENADSASISGTLSYSCTNSGDTAGYVSVCLGVDGGAVDPNSISPRYMAGPNNSKLAFNMMLSNGKVWGDRFKGGTEFSSGSFLIPAGPSTVSGHETVTTSLISGANNSQASQGLYTDNFSGVSTVLTVQTSLENFSVDCGTEETQGNTRFPFTVQATVTSSCFISATTDINLGSHSAGTINIAGNNHAISVTCPTGMPYNIGLSPSNGNLEGAGTMKGTGSNSDPLPYQLRSSSNGLPWGNTATANNVGNGVAGTGSGVPNSHTVYVTVPKTDVKPDNYSDIVSVTVNY